MLGGLATRDVVRLLQAPVAVHPPVCQNALELLYAQLVVVHVLLIHLDGWRDNGAKPIESKTVCERARSSSVGSNGGEMNDKIAVHFMATGVTLFGGTLSQHVFNQHTTSSTPSVVVGILVIGLPTYDMVLLIG